MTNVKILSLTQGLFIKVLQIDILFLNTSSELVSSNLLSRYSIFGNRIDHTLFDLKQYFKGKYCKLISSYKLPKTVYKYYRC